MIITEYRNAKRTALDFIDVEINHPDLGWTPFTCNPNDTGSAIDAPTLYNLIVANGDAAAYVPPTAEEINADKELSVRQERNYILESVVDPIVSNPLRWEALSSEDQEAYRNYRQSLLDIPEQAGFPDSVTWPVLGT